MKSQTPGSGVQQTPLPIQYVPLTRGNVSHNTGIRNVALSLTFRKLIV